MAILARASTPLLLNRLKLCSARIFITVLVLASVFSASVAGPRGTSSIPKCATFCVEPSLFHYETTSTYIYDYSTDVSTYVVHGSSGESRLHLRAKAEITPFSACDFQLTLKDVIVEESDLANSALRTQIGDSEALSRELEMRPLQFSYQNGKIESICSDEQNSVWVLNVKRGLLSMLQNTMDKGQQMSHTVQEIDVNGRCLTTYSSDAPLPHGAGTSQTVTRTKNLRSCNHRHSHISGIQSIPYTSSSPIQSLPLLAGTQTCTQVIQDSKIIRADCKEEHNFQPFDYIQSGARTNVVQKLTLLGEKAPTLSMSSDVAEKNMRTTTLLFESEETSSSSGNNVDNILKRMENLEEKNMTKIRPNAPEHFMEIIGQLRGINASSLKSIHSRATKVGKIFLLDALPFVGTPHALGFMRDMFLEKTLSTEHKDAWLTSLAFIKKPSIGMIEVLQPLLIDNPESQALFGISSMVHSYCREHSDCTSNTIITATMRKIYDLLHGCELQNENINTKPFLRTIYALKAIGNAGRLIQLQDSDYSDHSSQHLIEKCFRIKANPIEIRLAALDAFRRMPCNSYNQQTLIQVLRDTDESTEIRIQAYLNLMRCPNNELIKTLKEVFQTDTVNQVVSFMWTHLTNLQETSSPDKQLIRELLSNEELQNKFSSDARKFSRNYEGAKYWEKYNVGAGYDANLIFSPESFVPRSGMVNITTHLFGESINLLEFGVRVHAMEQLLEPIFGPAGYFPDQTVNQALHSMRVRRNAVSNQADRVASIYNEVGDDLASAQPGGSFYTRVFGNEIVSKSFVIAHKDRTVPTMIDENGKNWFDLTFWLDNMSKGKSMDYTKSSVIMDLSYTVPTSAGLPLTLNIQSASTVGISASGKIDLHKYWDQKELEIVGKLSPSAAIQVAGTMSVGLGQKVHSGLRIENTLHSSTAVEGQAMLKHGKLVHASFGLPQPKQELFQVKSQVYLVKPSGEKVPEKGPINAPTIAHNVCTPKTLEILLGIKICGDINIPESLSSSFFKVPSSVSLRVEKTDSFSSYDFSYKWERGPNKTDVEMVFDTPGSQINRRIATSYIYDVPNGLLKVGLETPSKSVIIDGEYSQNSSHFQLTAKSGSERVIFVNAELKKQLHRIEPHFVILFYEKPIVEIDGTAVGLAKYLNGDGKATFDVNVKQLTEKRINLNGELSRNGDMYDQAVSVTSHFLTGHLKSTVRANENVLTSKVGVEYGFNGGQMTAYNINGKIQKSRKGVLTKYYAIYNFTPVASPDDQFTFMWEVHAGGKFCENLLTIKNGQETRWTWKTVYSNKISKSHKDLRLEWLLQAPRRGFDYNFVLSHQGAENGFTSKCIARLGPQNEFNAQAQYLEGNSWQFKRNLTAVVKLNDWVDYSAKGTIDQSKPNEYDGEIMLKDGKNEMKATGSYKDRSSNTKLDYSMDFRARGPDSWPAVAGSASLIASEKLAQLGGNLNVGTDAYTESESDHPLQAYMGKWSGSLSYNAPKKNSRKFEGKLSLNDRKYHGTLNLRRTRNGDRTLVVDLNYGRRFFVEGKMSGAWPAPITTYVSIFPNKNKTPDYKLSFQSTMDAKSVNVRVDYFGELAEFAGSYERGRGQVEVQWVGSRQFMLSFDMSKLGWREAIFMINVEAPGVLDNFGVSLQHSLSSNHLSTQIGGNLNDDKSIISINGALDAPESQLSIIWDISQWRKLKTQLRMLKTPNQLVLDFSSQLGDDISRLRLEHTRTHQGVTCKVQFDGCSFVPKMLLSFSNQMSPNQFTDIDIVWASLDDSTEKKVNARLEGGAEPWNYNLHINTPWSPLDKMEIGVKTEFETKFAVDLSVAGSHSLFPLELKLESRGDLWDSDNKAKFSWIENGRKRSMKLAAENKIESWSHAHVKSSLELFDHKYKLDLSSKKKKHIHEIEASVSYNELEAKGGFAWQYEKRGNLVNVAAWTEYPDQPRMSFDYRHLNDENYFILDGHVKEADRTLGKIITEFHYTGLEHWEVTAKLNSVLNLIPAISFTSKHSIEDFNEIRHSTEFILTETNSKLWGSLEDTKVLLEFNLKNGRDLSGWVKVNEKEVKLVGLLENDFEDEEERQAQKVDLEISSQLFESIHATAEYKVDSESLVIGFSGSKNGTTFIAFNLGSKHNHRNHSIEGHVKILCPFGHQIEGEMNVDTAKNSIKIVLAETKQQALGFTFGSKVQAAGGHLKMSVSSKLLDALNIDINTEYKIEHGRIQVDAKYKDVSNTASVTFISIWKPSLKKFQLILQKADKTEINVELNGPRFISFLSHDEKRILSFEGTYSLERSEASSMINHIVQLVFKNRDQEPLKAVGIVGLGTNHVTLNLQTPFDGWNDWTFDAQMSHVPEKLTKIVQISLVNNKLESQKYRMNAEFGNHLLEIKLRTPIEGFTNMEAKLARIEEENIRIGFDGVWESNKMSFMAKLTDKNAEFDLKTPFEMVQNVHVSAGWSLQTPVRTMEAIVRWNRETHQVSAEWQLELMQGHGNLAVTTPILGLYKTRMHYSLVNNAQFEGAFENGHGKPYVLSANLDLSKPNEVELIIATPFSGYKTITLKLEYLASDDAQNYSTALHWSLDGLVQSVSAELSLKEPGKVVVIVKSPVKNWREMTLTLFYKLEKSRKAVEIHLDKEGMKYFEVKNELNHGGDLTDFKKNAKVSIGISVQTVLLPGYENVDVVAEYKRTARSNQQTVSVLVKRNDNALLIGTLNFQISNTKDTISMDLNGEISAPVFDLPETTMNGTFTSENSKNEKTLQLSMRQNGVEQLVKASHQWTSSNYKLELVTPLKALKNLQVYLHFQSDGRIGGVLELNKKRIDMDGQLLWNGLKNFKLTYEIKTPFSNFKSIHAQVSSKIHADDLLIDYVLQNDNVRYMGKIDGSRDEHSGQLKVQLSNPIRKLEQVLTSFLYNSSGMFLRMERNTKEEIVGLISYSNDKLEVGVKSKLPNYPIDGRAVIDFGNEAVTPNIGLNIDAKIMDTHSLQFHTAINGLGTGEVSVTSSMAKWSRAHLKWQLDGSLSSGQGKLEWDLPSLGSDKSVRTAWKFENYSGVQLEFWLSSPTGFDHEKGFSLQYSLSSQDRSNGKFGGTITYVLDKKEQQVTISTAMKKSVNTNSMEFTLQTPFELLKHFTLTSRLVCSPDVVLDLSATHNQVKIFTTNVVTFISPRTSKFKLSMSAPLISEAFNLNAGYDLTTSEKTLEILFSQNKYQLNVKAQAIIPNNPDEIELRMMVESNVPTVEVSASGSLRAGYKVQADDTRQIIVAINSEQTGLWKITAGIRPVADNFNIKLKIDTPAPEVIPSLQSEFKLTGSIARTLDAELYVQVGALQPTHATLSFGQQMVRANIKSGIFGLEDLGFDGTVESQKRDTVNHKFHFGVRSGRDSCRFEGDIQIPTDGHLAKGSIKLTSSWGMIPNASLGVDIGTDGTVVISGMWGPRRISIRGNVQKNNGSWRAMTADVSLSVNAEQIFRIQSKHFFNEKERSFNLTIGDSYKLETYYKASPRFNTFSSIVQWAPTKLINFVAEMGLGHFNASIKTPWTSDIQTHGEYRVTSSEYSGRGTCIVDGQESHVEANVLTSANSFISHLGVDIPLLNQKLDMNMKIVRPDEHYIEADFDMRMKDRRLAMKGSLSSNTHKHSDNLEMDEKLLKFTASLPFKKYSEIKGEFSLKKPVDSMSRVQIESGLTVGVQTATGRFHYQLPLDGSKSFSIGLTADAPFISPEKHEWLIDISDVNPMHFNGDIQYKTSHIYLSWSLEDEFSAKMFANMPTVLPDLSPINFEAKALFEGSKEAHLRSTLTWQTKSVTLQASLLNETNSLSGRVFLHAPFLLPESSEVTARLQKLDIASSRRHIIEITANHGKEALSSIGEVTLDRNSMISLSLKLSGYYGAHFIQFSTKQNNQGRDYEVELNAESVTLLKGKKMSVIGKAGLAEDGFGGMLECRTRQSTHVISTNVNWNPRHGVFSVKLESPYVKAINFDGEYSIDPITSALHVKLNTNIMNKSHVLKFGYDLVDPEAYLLVTSPILSSQVFNIHLMTKLREHVDVLADFNMFGHEWKLETKGIYVANEQLDTKLEIRTPFESLRRITIAIIMSPKQIHFEFYTPIEDLPNFVISIANVPLSGKVDFVDFNPQILIGLPCVTYSASGLILLPTKAKAGEISFMVGHGDPRTVAAMKEFRFGIQISPIERISYGMDEQVHVTLTLSTPYKHFKSFEFGFGGRINLRSWSDINLNVEVNGKEITFTSEVQREEATKRFVLMLKTPFENFEHTSFSVRLENYQEIGTGRNLQLDFDQSSMMSPIHMEIDYHYRVGENPLNLEGEVTIHLPDAKLPPIFLRARSGLLETGYDGVLEGHFGHWKPLLMLNVGFSPAHSFGTFEAKLEDTPYQVLGRFEFRQHAHEISVNAEIQLSNRQVLVANIEFVQTADVVKCNVFLKLPPVGDFNSIGAQLRISPLSKADSVTLEKLLHALDVSLGVTLNEKKVFQFELVSKHNQRSLEIHNPIQPISFVVSYQILRNQKLQVTSEFCWNLHKPEQSTVGARFNYARYPHGAHLLLKLQGGEFGTLVIDTSQVWSAVKFEQSLNLAWASMKLHQNTSFGYYVLYADEAVAIPAHRHTNNLVLRLNLPWRSIQTEHSVVVAKSTGKVSTTTHAELKWDAAVDPGKRIGYLSTLDTTTVKRSATHKYTFMVLHSGLPQNSMVFESERTFKSNKLHETEYIFKPNSNPQNQLTIRLSRENITDQGLQVMITHPSTNVDINSILSLSDTASLFYLAYLDIRGDRHVLHMEMRKTHHHRLYEVSFGPNINELNSLVKLETDYKPQDSEHVVALKTPFLEMDSQVRTTLPYLNAVIRHGTHEALALSIGLNHKRKIVLQVLRNEFGQNIQDLFVVARFNNSDMISTGVNWRPEMFQEFRKFVTLSLPRFAADTFDGVIPAALERMNEEVEERLKVIDPGLDRLYVSLTRFIGNEFQSAIAELGVWFEYVCSEYEDNAFYLKDFVTLTGSALQAVYDSCSRALELLQDVPSKAFKFVSNTYNDLRTLSQQYTGNLEAVVMNAWKSAEKLVSNVWNAWTKKLNAFLAKGRRIYDTVMAVVEGNLDLLEQKIYGVDLLRKLACLYEDYTSWLKELPIQGYLQQLKDIFNKHVLDPLEEYYKPYFVVVNQIIEDGNLYALLDVPPMPYVRYISTSLMDSSSRLWKFVEAEQRIRDLFGEILGRVNNLIQRHIPLGQLSYEIEKGHFEFHQPLTFIEWEDFTHLPKWRVPVDDVEDISRINELYYTLLDTLRVTQPFSDLDIRKILPPFGTTALMAGDHHYLTFDKKYFRFAGDCNSYVLIADLVHQNFSLLANYETSGAGGTRKKSYSLISGKKVIEFDVQSFKVTLDGRKMELPLEVGPTFVRRQANGLEIFDSRGFQIQCGHSPSVCSISVSGWYFGKLAGLLGTYDNEPSNDFRRPDGRIVHDVAAFAYSWRVGSNSGQCRPRSYAREFSEYLDLDGICKEYLTNMNSPFRPCFNEVPPQPFIDMCKYDVTANRNSVYRQESACTAINAYVTECQRNKVDLWAPTICVKCKLEDGSSIAGFENATLEEDSYISPPQAADVVVIIEETSALKEYNLNEAILKLQNALKTEGLENNRYTVVGFGGSDRYKTPHIRTNAGQVWTTSTLFKIPDAFPMDGERNGNLYEAIEFGSKIGFRAGVAKIMIAIIADDYSSRGVHRGYADTYTLLVENDIRLHVLSPKDITLKSNKRDDGNKIFGIDRDGVFTLWQSKRGSGQSDRALRRYVNLPKDYYTPLTFESKGSRFNMNWMKTYLNKTFLDVWSRRVARTAQPAKCQRCECEPDKFGGAITSCQPCVSPIFTEFLQTWSNIRSEMSRHEAAPAGVAPADNFSLENFE